MAKGRWPQILPETGAESAGSLRLGGGSVVKKSGYASALALVVMCLSAIPVLGQATWAGGAGNWNVAANWCPTGVPANGSDITVGNCKSGSTSVVTVNVSPTINNLTIAGSNSVTVVNPNRLTIGGSSVSNAGTLGMAGSGSSGAQMQLTGTTVTLSGGGILLMNDAPNLVLGNVSTVLVNQETIRGAGTLGAEGVFNMNNQGLVDAQGTNPLNIQTNTGTMLNTGTLQASNGGTLKILLNGLSSPSLNNAGGTIKALDGSLVRLMEGVISGGTLTTAGSGMIQGQGGTLMNLTNAGLFQIGGLSGQGSANWRFSGTLTNTGTIRIGSAAWGDDVTSINGTVTLTGGGTVNFANSIESMVGSGATLVNTNNTISGTGVMGGGGGLTLTNSGTVDANAATPLLLVMSMTNSGTMQASHGGELRTQGDINNAGGTITALDGSKVTLVSNTIKGGTFATSGSGFIQAAPTQPALDGLTNTGMVLVPNNAQMALKNTITNSGTIFLDSTGGPVSFIISGPVTLTGKGTMMLSDNTGNFISGGGSSPTWSNVDNLIEGGGTIGVSFTNQKKGIFLANLSTPLIMQGSSQTNLGKFQVNPGSVLRIPSATFTNFAGNTLTGGTYVVGGTFAFGGANIVTNAANLQLTSPTAQILNSFNNANAIANLSSNAKKGSLTVSGKAVVTTTPSFTNGGKTTVSANSKFTVGGTYTQTAGTTKVDGTLTAPAGFLLQGGTLFGKGTIASAVTSSASVTAGDTVKASGKLSITGSYTQQAAGGLNVQIGGTTVGGKYSQLAVSNGVSLAGTLNIALIKNFLPAIGDTFTIVTSSARTGQFATVNGLSINSGEHFQITYAANAVQLQVVSGP